MEITFSLAEIDMAAESVLAQNIKKTILFHGSMGAGKTTFIKAIARKLGVMDLTAICLVRDHNMPLRVFNMNKKGALLNLMLGGNEGTLVESA